MYVLVTRALHEIGEVDSMVVYFCGKCIKGLFNCVSALDFSSTFSFNVCG